MTFSLNSWRFWLAFMVAISHLLDGFTQGPAAYAVWGFFVMSGFLMTLTLKVKYFVVDEGIKKYAINRFLRIYPMYVCSLALGFIVLIFARKHSIDPHYLNPEFGFPQSLLQLIQNIIPLPFFDQKNLLVPVAWALFIELFAYLIMPLLAREKNVAWMAFIIGSLANYQLGVDLSTFVFRYSGIGTSMMAFSMGALLVHYKDKLDIIAMPKISVFAWLLNCSVWYYNDLYPWGYGLYVSLILSAWVTISLIDIKPSRLGNFLGEISYPVYLTHTAIGIAVSIFTGAARTFTMFSISFFLCILISSLFVLLIDRNIEKFKYHNTKLSHT